jgi:hypothetical protein
MFVLVAEENNTGQKEGDMPALAGIDALHNGRNTSKVVE